jgi:hypothetical protein
VKFDVAQLEHILRSSAGVGKRSAEWPLLEIAKTNMTSLLQSLNTAGMNWKADDAVRSSSSSPLSSLWLICCVLQVIALTSAQRITAGQINNRVLYLAPETTFPEYTQIGAMNHISTMMQGIDNMDFLVVDGILLANVIPALVDMALQSTIWFDVSTGNSFIAHSDDGLVQSAFHQLGKVSQHPRHPPLSLACLGT